MGEMILQTLPFEEIDKIEALWKKLIESNGKYSEHFADLYATFSFPVRKSFLQEKLESGFAVETWVLRSSQTEELKGFCSITYHDGEHIPGKSSGELEMIYVDDSLRGQGLGSRLLKVALDRFAEQGIGDLKLSVTYGNEGALRLYEKFGFYPFTIDCLRK